MKLRIIDRELVPAFRKPVDAVWTTYANHLLTAFGDITQQNGFSPDDVELVYCPHRLRDIDERILDSLVYNVPPAFVDQDILLGRENDLTAATYFDTRIQWRASSDSPFLLLGYVGTGKTTFLDYYFSNHVPKTMDDIRGILVNFKTAPDKHDDLLIHMLDEVDRALSDIEPTLAGFGKGVLDQLYSTELAAMRENLQLPTMQQAQIDLLLARVIRAKGEKDIATYADYVGRKIRILKDRSIHIWIILDNIDQHFHCLHHESFVNAIAIVYKWGCPLIMSMRYVTLHTPAGRQTYDSFRPRRLKLSFPNLTDLIRRRIDFFKLLADPTLQHRLKWTGGTLAVADLAEEIKACTTLLSGNDFLKRILLPLSNYNLRRLLDILLVCFQSYYFFFDRFNKDRYLPTDVTLEKRFLFSHLLKNNDYYDPSSRNDQEQFILNLFENENPATAYNQLIRIRLLQVLMGFGRHISLPRYVNHVNAVFAYQQEDILQALRVFLEKELIALKNIVEPTFDDSILHHGLQDRHIYRPEIEIALTYSGRLHFDLLFSLEYVEAMKFSTYVDNRVYHDIQDPESQTSLERRAKSTRRFLEYLANEEKIEITHCLRDRTKFETEIKEIMPDISARINRKLQEVSLLPEHRRHAS